MTPVFLLECFVAATLAAGPLIHSDKPNVVTFPAAEARFVRFVIHASSSSQPCIDELEIYGPEGTRNLALAEDGARATASSCLPGYAIHRIAHLNDGRYGNQYSWIAAGTGVEWVQIELPGPTKVAKVVFSRDRAGRYADRVPIHVEVRLSVDGKGWKSVRKVAGQPSRTAVRAPDGVFGGSLPQPPPPPGADEIGSDFPPRPDRGIPDAAELLRYAVLGEEHAWLKTYGRADLSPRLVPYNGRVKEYPRHVGDDLLPLPPLASAPQLDGDLDDPCWAGASRGVVRVAWPYDFEQGPLIEYAVTAGYRQGDLYLAIRTNRLLSSHLAVVSCPGGSGGGVVVCTKDGLLFCTYDRGRLRRSTPVEGKFDKSLSCFEVRLPLSLFPDCRTQGLRVGLGMGGKHTRPYGRAVNFVFAPVSMGEVSPCLKATFRVRLAVPPDGNALKLRGNAPGLIEGIRLAPGESRTVSIPAQQGAIGPEYTLTIDHGAGEPHVLHLFRYDPLGRTLTQMEEMLERFSAKGLDGGNPPEELAALRRRHQSLLAEAKPDPAAERKALFDARVAKRRLFFREPDLAPIRRTLFVKRQAFQPSHNYSVNLDARFRPGGGVYLLEIPRPGGRFEPDEAELTELFASGGGIARNPMASFDLSRIYFGYLASEDGYYHIMSTAADGGSLEQLTDGPFHDYWPCPLPDGGIALISTRCKARYLCWRPQAAVMYRMDADGRNLRPLSFANLSEWAPSVTGDGRIIWTRSEYIDKGADFSHTLWSIRPDGTKPELVFGNTIIQPNGYANGRQVPGSSEICCTLISHFGDLNGPIALVDLAKGRFNPKAIRSITPEVPWPGMWPMEECFRDPVPVARDYFLCSHAPRDRFALYVIDRFGNREILYLDPKIGSMCPTPFCAVAPPPALNRNPEPAGEDARQGQFILADVYRGIEPAVRRGTVKYLRVAGELRADLIRLPDGQYQKDHTPFEDWYATPVHKVRGPHGWPSYVAKATWGIAPVEADGSANFRAPAGKVLYFQALDKDFNELQRMRSVVQLQPGEKRSCIGCHEDRRHAPAVRQGIALRREPSELKPPPWGAGPFSYEKVVQPVWDANCTSCHDADDEQKIDLYGTLDADKVPASYRTLISQGWVHYLDWGYNSGGNEKRRPLTFGTLKSKLWEVLDAGHYDVRLSHEEMRRVKCWTDLNCPLWPDYTFRGDRPGPAEQLSTTD